MKNQLAKIAVLIGLAVAVTACNSGDARFGTPPLDWNSDKPFDQNMDDLYGTPIDDHLQWQIDDIDIVLFTSGYHLDERYWASYLYYADVSCGMFDEFLQFSIDENWRGPDAHTGFQAFLDQFSMEIRVDGGMSWVRDREARAILAAGMTLGGCEDLALTYQELVGY